MGVENGDRHNAGKSAEIAQLKMEPYPRQQQYFLLGRLGCDVEFARSEVPDGPGDCAGGADRCE